MFVLATTSTLKTLALSPTLPLDFASFQVSWGKKKKKKKTLVLLAPARVCHSDEFSAHIKGVGCEERQKLSDTRGTPSEVDGGGALVFTQEGVCVRNS